MKLTGRRAATTAAVVLILVGMVVMLGGAALYLQKNAAISNLPMGPGLPANPDATIGIIGMVMGAVMIASGIFMQLFG